MQRAKSGGGRQNRTTTTTMGVGKRASERDSGKWTGEKRLNLSSVSSVVAVAVDISGGGADTRERGRRQTTVRGAQ